MEQMEHCKGWQPLAFRYERVILGQPGPQPGQSPSAYMAKSSGYKYWRARVLDDNQHATGAKGERWCMLQIANNPEDRTPENIRLDMIDAEGVAAHAQRFNVQMARLSGDDPETVPGIKVCIPTGAMVVESPVPQIFSPGDALSLLPYSAFDVTKFVYDGNDQFLEIPHAFFHHVAWATGGTELVSDLQGIEEEDGSVLLVNPCLTKSGPSAALQRGPPRCGPPPPVPSPELFEKLHPNCGPVCKTFDPERRGKPQKRHCGIPISCGVGASN